MVVAEALPFSRLEQVRAPRGPRGSVTLHFSGLCEPRDPGGYACWGWEAREQGDLVAVGYGCLGHGPWTTKSHAEYQALLQAARWADRLRLREVTIRGDSMLVVSQVTRVWALESVHLLKYCCQAMQLMLDLQGKLEWVPREQNEAADTLSRRAYAIATQGVADAANRLV